MYTYVHTHTKCHDIAGHLALLVFTTLMPSIMSRIKIYQLHRWTLRSEIVKIYFDIYRYNR